MHQRTISATQLTLLMAASSFGGLLFRDWSKGILFEGAVLAASIVFSGLLAGMMVVCGCEGADCGAVTKVWTAVVGAALLWAAASTLERVGSFYAAVVYQRSPLWMPIVILGLSCVYGAGLGLEPSARFGLIGMVCAGCLLLYLMVGQALGEQWQQSTFDWRVNPSDLLKQVGLLPEAGLFLLLRERVANKEGTGVSASVKILWRWAALTLAAVLWLGGLMMLGGANVEDTMRKYTVFTFSSGRGFSYEGRGDLWFLGTATVCSFLRICACIYAGAAVLGKWWKGGSLTKRVWICGGLVIAASIWKIIPVNVPSAMTWGLTALAVLTAVVNIFNRPKGGSAVEKTS